MTPVPWPAADSVRAARRRPPTAALGLALFAALSGCGDAAPEPALGRPPIVLVVLDAVAARRVSHLGGERPTTPVLDALAAEGTTFRRAIAPAPYTIASIPSLLTGRLPDHHGHKKKWTTLVPEELTLAEVLKAAGYRTFGAVANVNGGSAFGIDQGFDRFEELYLPAQGRADDAAGAEGEQVHLPRAMEFPPVVERWLDLPAEGADAGAPAFLYLHVLEPHSPFDPPEEYRSLWLDPAYAGPFLRGDNETLQADVNGRIRSDERDREAVRALYDANLRYADAALGAVLDLLRARGLYDRALIVVTSDHGEAFWEHGLVGHNLQLYDEMLHVPLVVKLPSGVGRPGGAVDEMVSPMDLLPTVAEWLGLELPPLALDGISLAPLVEGTGRAGADWPAGRALRLRTNHTIPHLGLRTDALKTIAPRDPVLGATLHVERYDLALDPLELDDRSRESIEECTRIERELQFWIRTIKGDRARRSQPLTEGQEAQLRKLGYAE